MEPFFQVTEVPKGLERLQAPRLFLARVLEASFFLEEVQKHVVHRQAVISRKDVCQHLPIFGLIEGIWVGLKVKWQNYES